MAQTRNATYKVFNGTDWDVIYFKTSAAQVGVSSSRKFVTSSTSVNGVNFELGDGDAASVTISGANIAAGVAWEGPTTLVTDSQGNTSATLYGSESIATFLDAITKAVNAAYAHVPSGILTTANYSDTLNSVYVPQTRTINNKPLSSNIELGAGDIPLFAGVQGSISVGAKFMALDAQISGIGQPMCINVDGEFESTEKNALLKSTDNDVTIDFEQTVDGLAKIKYNIFTETKELVTKFNLGDVVYIKQLDFPDRWVSAVTINTQNPTHILVTFSKLETYNMTWAAITGKPTTIAGYGITDAVPYTGAEYDVNLGAHTLSCSGVTVGLGNITASVGNIVASLGTIQGNNLKAQGTTDDYIIITSSGFKKGGTLNTGSASAEYTLKLPNIDGTLMSDGMVCSIYFSSWTVAGAAATNQAHATFDVGDYYKYDGRLCRVTSSIGGNDTWAQCQAKSVETTIAEELKRKATVTVADTAPTNPASGDLWIDISA